MKPCLCMIPFVSMVVRCLYSRTDFNDSPFPRCDTYALSSVSVKLYDLSSYALKIGRSDSHPLGHSGHPHPRQASLYLVNSISLMCSFSQIADWLEYYAQALELNVWTRTNVDKIEETGTSEQTSWNVHVTRGNGQKRVLKPRHIIFATGVYGGPARVPKFPGVVCASI